MNEALGLASHVCISVSPLEQPQGWDRHRGAPAHQQMPFGASVVDEMFGFGFQPFFLAVPQGQSFDCARGTRGFGAQR
jgi:hypothetical protein